MSLNLGAFNDTVKQCLLDNGAMNALMSGSGPTVFGIFNNMEDARNAKKELWGNTKQYIFVHPYKIFPQWQYLHTRCC